MSQVGGQGAQLASQRRQQWSLEGGQSQARQGVCLDGHSDRERHSEEGQILDHIDHDYTIGPWPEICDIQQSEFLVSDL